MTTERRFCELRFDEHRGLRGIAMPYGTVAALPWGQERFEPFAFGDLADADLILNVFHDRGRPVARTRGGGLTFADTSDALRVEALLPETRAADEALSEVRAGLLRGFSVEFRALEERQQGHLRIVQRAILTDLGLVDRPAYEGATVHARMAQSGQRRKRLWL